MVSGPNIHHGAQCLSWCLLCPALCLSALGESLLCSLLCVEGDAAVTHLEGSTLPAWHLAWLLLREEYP